MSSVKQSLTNLIFWFIVSQIIFSFIEVPYVYFPYKALSFIGLGTQIGIPVVIQFYIILIGNAGILFKGSVMFKYF